MPTTIAIEVICPDRVTLDQAMTSAESLGMDYEIRRRREEYVMHLIGVGEPIIHTRASRARVQTVESEDPTAAPSLWGNLADPDMPHAYVSTLKRLGGEWVHLCAICGESGAAEMHDEYPERWPYPVPHEALPDRDVCSTCGFMVVDTRLHPSEAESAAEARATRLDTEPFEDPKPAHVHAWTGDAVGYPRFCTTCSAEEERANAENV